MFDVTLTESADFGGDGFLLLQEHTAGFEIANLGNHCTLHYCAAFVIFDVAHPPRFFEGDIFCEPLLLKVSNSIIIGIGQKMLNWRGCFDVIFQVGHQMSTVTLDLLIG